MEHKIRFDVLHGRCATCDGPVYFTQTLDHEGNRIHAFHCWNGHYRDLSVLHVEYDRTVDLTAEQIEEILPFLDFVRIDDEDDTDLP